MKEIRDIRQIVEGVSTLAQAKGRRQTFEFELYLLGWQAQLVEQDPSEELAGLVEREAAQLRHRIETMTAA